jgi:MFS family permease
MTMRLVVQQHPLQQEVRSTLSLAAIFAFRMLGLFMILPIFAIAAKDYSGASPRLIGFALGGYGLSQALLQIPFGALSDRLGRKPILIVGLALFALGSLLGGLATSLYGLIIARLLQGAGAIGSTIMATMADLTKVENRTKAMAAIGLTVGLSFSIALVVGPLLYRYIGLAGIFYLTAILALLGILIVIFAIPQPPRFTSHQQPESLRQQLAKTLQNTELLRLNYGIFISHTLLTAAFVALPTLLQTAGMDLGHQWQFYLPILLCAFIGMLPFMIMAERYRLQKPMLLLAITALFFSQCGLYLRHSTLWDYGFSLIVFFMAFSLLEALLPSLVSKIAPIHSKGAALGIYSTSQFLGIFFGGTTAGIVQSVWQADAVFLYCATLAASWLLIALFMCKPLHLETKIINLKALNPAEAADLSQKLNIIKGVVDVSILLEHGIAYLRVDNTILDRSTLAHATQAFVRD